MPSDATQPNAAASAQALPAPASIEAKSGPVRLNVINREGWLTAVAGRMAPWFADLGCPLPRVRMAVVFTSKGRRSRRIGECWSPKNSADGTHEIFIVPTIDDALSVADTLAHELVHAAVGVQARHGPAFRKVALAIGLQGKMRATTPGPLFLERVAPILAAVGPLPHARLDHSSGPPKQTTRLLKCYCPECGYTVRVAAKWLNAFGPPICPTHHVYMFDVRWLHAHEEIEGAASDIIPELAADGALTAPADAGQEA